MPIGFQYNDDHEIPTINLPTIVNEDELQKADSIEEICATCEGKFYGIGIDQTINIKVDGYMFEVQDSNKTYKVWTLSVNSPTSEGFQFYFNKFNLPLGANLFIYNSDKNLLGPYSEKNNPSDPLKPIQFGTPIIQSNSVIIEYSEPIDADFQGEIVISKVIHIFKDIFTESGQFGVAETCMVNVMCPLTYGWEDEISSVAIILVYTASLNYTGWCTGALLNNTAQDGRPLFLTAYHCADPTPNTPGSYFDYSTWTFLFNHQSANCEDDGSEIPHGMVQSIYGANYLAGNNVSVSSDYLLLELHSSQEELSTFHACYAGWTIDAPSTVGPYLGIHHAGGDAKKASRTDVLSGGGPSSPVVNSLSDKFWIVDWNDNEGSTEPGSSGSPLFDNNHQVVGQLYGIGNTSYVPPCDPTKLSGYGKFAESWLDGAFQSWLDPFSTGLTSIDTYCPSGNGLPIHQPTTSLCFGNMQDGLAINGILPPEVPCVDLIHLSPVPHCELNTVWAFHPDEITNDCADFTNTDLCCQHFPWIWRCTCTWVNYFLEVVEVNSNLDLIGPSYSRWFRWHIDNNCDPINDYYSSGFDATGLLEIVHHMDPGHYYKIKLAHVYFGQWIEGSAYILKKPSDVNISNLTLTNNIRGDIVVLNSVTV